MTYLFKTKNDRQQREVAQSRWLPPPEDWVCLNVDAALFPAEKRMGWGAVLRDHTGTFLFSCAEGLDGLPVPELAEAIAARSALTMARDKGFQKVIMVSDCLSLVQRISSSAQDRSLTGIVVGDIKCLMTDFESCSVKFSSRNFNVVAHTLTRSAEPLVCKFSATVIPELIRAELCNDVC
jgi:ribonuclease HI